MKEQVQEIRIGQLRGFQGHDCTCNKERKRRRTGKKRPFFAVLIVKRGMIG